MKIKLNGAYQREELEHALGQVAQTRNVTADKANVLATVAYVDDDLIDALVAELRVSRTEALNGRALGNQKNARGRCNAIGSVQRAILAARTT